MVMQDVNHQLFTESVLEEIILSMEEDMEDARLRGEVILHELSLDMFQNVHPMALSGGQKAKGCTWKRFGLGKGAVNT